MQVGRPGRAHEVMAGRGEPPRHGLDLRLVELAAEVSEADPHGGIVRGEASRRRKKITEKRYRLIDAILFFLYYSHQRRLPPLPAIRRRTPDRMGERPPAEEREIPWQNPSSTV